MSFRARQLTTDLLGTGLAVDVAQGRLAISGLDVQIDSLIDRLLPPAEIAICDGQGRLFDLDLVGGEVAR